VENLAQQSAYHNTHSVRLLRQLQNQRVYIDVAQIRRALRTRFAILYNPRESRVARNELLRRQNVSTRKDMVVRLNIAWGADIWLDTDNAGREIDSDWWRWRLRMGNCHCNLTDVEESLLEESELLSQSNAMWSIIAPIRVDLKYKVGWFKCTCKSPSNRWTIITKKQESWTAYNTINLLLLYL